MLIRPTFSYGNVTNSSPFRLSSNNQLFALPLSSILYKPINHISRPLCFSTLDSFSDSLINKLETSFHEDIEKIKYALTMQQKFEEECLKSQLNHMEKIRSSLFNKADSIILSSSRTISTLNNFGETQRAKDVSPLKKDIRTQIEEMMNFIIENFGRVDEICLEQEKTKYSQNKDLIVVFDLLLSKYSTTTKTKEEMIKYSLRKALKFLKSKLKRENNSNPKVISQILCRKYFNISQDEISKMGNEEEFLKHFLPFRKNSNYKTINNSFVYQVFSSQEFCSDYKTFLESFEYMLESDNKSKSRNFVDFIEESIQLGRLNDIKRYKNIPWLKLWILNTKKIANNLPSFASQVFYSSKQVSKKVKIEESSSSENFEITLASTE